eukprot:14601475-Alexandrium_andersonii.AAC.1
MLPRGADRGPRDSRGGSVRPERRQGVGINARCTKHCRVRHSTPGGSPESVGHPPCALTPESRAEDATPSC